MFVTFQNHNKIHTPEQRLMADFIQKIINNQNEQYLSHIIINKFNILNKSIIELATSYLWDQILAQLVTGI